MGDLISKDAAIDGLMQMVYEHAGYSASGLLHYTGVRAMLECLSAVDATPVVKCRDCKYGKLYQYADGDYLIECTNKKYPAANIETWPLELDWYCAGGERR